MKAPILFLFLCLASLGQQPPPAAAPPALPNLPDETVVAIFDDGVKFTMGELKRIMIVLPPESQQNILVNRKAFMEQWALMRKLAQLAEQTKLDQKSPFREQLAYYRMQILSSAAATNASNTASVVNTSEIPKFYEANKDRYKEVRVKAIYVAFGQASGGKKAVTEEQAKAKAGRLLEQIRKGADFVKLVKENSDDQSSREKDGDFGVIKPGDNLPDAFRQVLFSMKQGEVSEPLRQPGGYYLLRAEQVTFRPLEQVQDEIFAQLRGDKFKKWMDEQRDATRVEFPNPEFLAPPQPAK